ncbi:hypothetical protein [Pedobacter sp.]
MINFFMEYFSIGRTKILFVASNVFRLNYLNWNLCDYAMANPIIGTG